MVRCFFVLSLALVLSGCARKEPKPAVNINAPGVNLKVDERGNTNIEAPGVNIKTNN